MIQIKTLTFPAFTGPEKRRLYIYLPVGYEYEPERRYPVLYMFDGHNVFYDNDATYGKSWGLGKYLDWTQTPLIVAALECHHGDNNERLFEYSPYNFSEEGFGDVVGFGDKTMKYFTGPLKTYVDRHYRTLKDRENTFIAGSSMGGLMSLYAILKYNKFYSKAAALSPSIFFCYKNLTNLVKKSHLDKDTTIYMDMGSEEMTFEGGSSKAYADFGSLMISRDISLTQRVVPNGVHTEESWEKQLPIFLNVLLYE